MSTLAIREQQVLYDQKWFKFLRRAWLFRFIPFIDFVFGSGSMASGNVNPNSDFDVLVGAREGRIYTVRFTCVILFGLFGWRRTKMDHYQTAKDKVCFNHFVTPAAYTATFTGREKLARFYASLVPVYGAPALLERFMAANRWAGERTVGLDSRHKWQTSAGITRWLENMLAGQFGNRVEAFLKRFQVERIKRGLPKQEPVKTGVLPPLIIYNDHELKFHPDPLEIG